MSAQTNQLMVTVAVFLPAAALLTAGGCRLEGALDKFGGQLMESLDNTPVPLVEVIREVEPPAGVPNSDDMEVPVRPDSAALPVYPERLRKKGIEGKAVVLFVVDSTGVIVNPQITYATDTSFAASLLDAVATWKVLPCEEEGRPVTCYKKLTFDFELR